MAKYFNMADIKSGDRIFYLTCEKEKGFFEEQGIVKEDNLYAEGVEVYGDGWKQYVGQWFITKILRDDKIIWEADNE